jgi:hypothetical protein
MGMPEAGYRYTRMSSISDPKLSPLMVRLLAFARMGLAVGSTHGVDVKLGTMLPMILGYQLPAVLWLTVAVMVPSAMLLVLSVSTSKRESVQFTTVFAIAGFRVTISFDGSVPNRMPRISITFPPIDRAT